MKKRERFDVINDILVSIKKNKGKIKPTRLLYSSNLSSLMFKDYISDLTKTGLIAEVKDSKGRKHYEITEKGHDFLRKYSMFNEFVGNLGL
ncbi:MAG: winged helix-turn-helix domain-containing protein [Candidatus Nanoarchaeia archaeon]|nr:winged helix-turn-helix domain-containing protein [Candidatus Nanoarchaeia archaeon]